MCGLRCDSFPLGGEAVRGPARGLMRGELPWPPVSGILREGCPSSGPAGPPSPKGEGLGSLRPQRGQCTIFQRCVRFALRWLPPRGGGSCPRPRPRTDEGRVTVAARKRDVMGKLPLIRPCGATCSQGGRFGITPPPARPMHHLQRRCARPWCAFRCPAGSTRWQSGHRRLQCPAPRRAGCPCRPAAPAWP